MAKAGSPAIGRAEDQPRLLERCVFCRIVAGEAGAAIVHRDERLIAFRDVHPVAPTHILIIPTRHISSLNDTGLHEQGLLGEMLHLAQSLAERENVAGPGYRLVINTGPEAGQSVAHLHAHLLAGRVMAWPPG